MRNRRQGRFTAAVLVAVATLLAGLTSPVAAQNDESGQWTKEQRGGDLTAPPGPNPFLAFTADGKGDYDAWSTYTAHMAAQRAGAEIEARSGGGGGPVTVKERRRDNDTPDRAQRIRLRTRNNRGTSEVNIAGEGPPPVDGDQTDAGFATEPNGSIPDAQVLPVLAVGDGASGAGVIGDEPDDPFDFDFLALPGLSAGDNIVIDIDTPEPLGDLDSFIAFWSADGSIIGFNDDGTGGNFDSLLQVTVPADGDYYVSVGGFGAFVPVDPFDSASPSQTGAPGSLGEYSYSINSIQVDRDHYKFRLRQGDIFGANLFDGSRMELYGPNGQLLIGSSQDATGIHPEASPLPGGGNAALSYVIDQRGLYTLAIDTSSDYVAELRGFRPRGDEPGRGRQVLFLDFDGGSVDTGIYGAPFGVRELSPLVDFLPNWGLGPDDEDAVIDAIVESVRENLEHDIEEMGGNRRFDIEIVDSRARKIPTGRMVSTIIVGGSIEEFGIGTIGIAQSIDVGNFETSETAVVLLDLLSAPVDSPDFMPNLSLNSFEVAPGASLIDLIGTGVGNVTAHEAGHFFANFHTDQFNPTPNIQDQGGNFPNTLGVGPDLVFGSADDVDVDFGADTYVPAEGFSGTENTLTSIAFGLWTPIRFHR